MKHDLAKLALPIGLLGLNVAISLGFLISGRLPDPAPAGFWIDGSVLSEAPAWQVAFRMPMVAAVLLLCIAAALKWDPRFAPDQRRRGGAWGPITTLVMAVSCLGNFNFLTVAAAGIFVLKPLHVIPSGLLLFGLGNYVAKSASNGFWALHTRWTRRHESVSRRTNRLLGILWMAEGLGLILASPLFARIIPAHHPEGLFVLLSLVPALMLGFLPIGIAMAASAAFAKQAPETVQGE